MGSRNSFTNYPYGFFSPFITIFLLICYLIGINKSMSENNDLQLLVPSLPVELFIPLVSSSCQLFILLVSSRPQSDLHHLKISLQLSGLAKDHIEEANKKLVSGPSRLS